MSKETSFKYEGRFGAPVRVWGRRKDKVKRDSEVRGQEGGGKGEGPTSRGEQKQRSRSYLQVSKET